MAEETVVLLIPEQDWNLVRDGIRLDNLRAYRGEEDFPVDFKKKPAENPVVRVRLTKEEA